MKWFRSNIGLGSRLALFALAIQFLLSFGHFHGSAQAASASADVKQPGLLGTAHLSVSQADLLDRVSHANASQPVRFKTSDHHPVGPPADDCAICAVMALANAMVLATPPCLPAPQSAEFRYLATDAAFADPNSAHVAFRPRAPPIA
jgi:hypothetical protein